MTINKNKIIALVQARMGSKRCPGKSLAIIQGVPTIGIVLRRLIKAKRISKVFVVTSNLKRDLILKKYIESIGFEVFCGNEKDLIKRFLLAFKKFGKNQKYFLRVHLFLCAIF